MKIVDCINFPSGAMVSLKAGINKVESHGGYIVTKFIPNVNITKDDKGVFVVHPLMTGAIARAIIEQPLKIPDKNQDVNPLDLSAERLKAHRDGLKLIATWNDQDRGEVYGILNHLYNQVKGFEDKKPVDNPDKKE